MAAERETLHLAQQLSKTDDVERQQEILKLIGDLEITYDILCSTKVATLVKPLKKSAHNAVATQATDLLRRWREIANDYSNVYIYICFFIFSC
jgi:hypothetical protein